ncbi:MAG: hypothetical protein QM396_03165 [Euryarchaeota archaeon]|nr:hypothetical protein [Euryarchaeota archaeon]
MINYFFNFIRALQLGIRTGYHTFCDEVWKYHSWRALQKRRVFT